jgi:hypothetical protein
MYTKVFSNAGSKSISSRVTRLGDFSPNGRYFTLGRFIKITDVAQKLHKVKVKFGYFFVSLEYALILTKNGFGYILGDFVTNSSGHPGFKLRNFNFLT